MCTFFYFKFPLVIHCYARWGLEIQSYDRQIIEFLISKTKKKQVKNYTLEPIHHPNSIHIYSWHPFLICSYKPEWFFTANLSAEH